MVQKNKEIGFTPEFATPGLAGKRPSVHSLNAKIRGKAKQNAGMPPRLSCGIMEEMERRNKKALIALDG